MDSVDLEPHDPRWRDRFERERDRIRDVAPDHLCGAFHIGSTAVPDLAAKPVVDVLAIYGDPASLRRAVNALLDGGYERGRDESDWKVLYRSTDDDSIVLHLRTRDSDGWRDQLVFRDYLRDNPGKRAEYERTKRVAAETHPHDVDAYTQLKEPTIRSMTERAYDEGYDEYVPDVR